MILATEMTKHFEHLAKFMNAFSTRIPEMYIEVMIIFIFFSIFIVYNNFQIHEAILAFFFLNKSITKLPLFESL